MTQGKVTVLLSTYNGSKFLKQQLNSLYEQTYRNIKILVRDDGSTDATREFLEAEQVRGAIELLEGHTNLGATRSFFELLRLAALSDTEYVAFCDQDDVWLPDKIECAVSALAALVDPPALYCSRLEIVDEQLNPIGLTAIPRKIGFGNALVENIAVGCTMMLNRKALDMICSKLPDNVYIHDWWCYLLVSCFGEVIFDSNPHLRYRQHGNNAIGAATSKFQVLKRKLARMVSGRLWISEQAAVFSNLFESSIPLSDRQILNQFIKAKSSYWSRIRLAFSKQIWRQKWSDNLILRLVILINRI
ncbi:glycosyltransferase family 2 protein [Methylobacter svalbardensis]|uniref:glycosyltransferase family 2 protein n=1 Tax=Methylobacter svalbardensis TaxID=3080016 RepID=UPI0030EB1E75